jgi:hypothetical protein
MKKFAFLTLLALAFAVSSCGNGSSPPTTTTTTNSNWEAQLTGGIGPASQLNFVTQFEVTVTSGDTEPLDVRNFGFFNSGACFETGLNVQHLSGTTTLNNSSTGQVTGTLTFNVQSITPPGNTLTLIGNVTGTSNATTTTQGTLSNGVVQGGWTLTGSSDCTGAGTFLMCQGTATCTVP